MASKRQAEGDSSDKRSNGGRIFDPRFDSISRSSLYRRPSNRKSKVSIDKRFAPMLTDERFSSKAKVDRYGRKVRTTTKSRDGKTNVELARLYQIDPEEEEQTNDTPDSDDEIRAELSRVAKKYGDTGYDPARQGGFSESSSSEDESESDAIQDESAESVVEDDDIDSVPEGEISRRLAVVNLDWDHVRAVDLLAVFSSYASTGRAADKVEKITIYPSEFGKERMEREEMEGPPKELFTSQKRSQNLSRQEEEEEQSSPSDSNAEETDSDEDEDERIRKSLVQEDDGEEVSATKLRNYQLERLRYFYAVVTCSTPDVAKQIYDNVDGREYLTSANFFDLRFIPEEMEFDDQPRDECTSIPTGYKPNEFVTAALQHSKVKLTWDADDTQRKEIQQRAFSGSRKDINENELRAYLASDASSDEDVQESKSVGGGLPQESAAEIKRRQMRAKLGLSDQPSKKDDEQTRVGDMQVTFTPAFSSNSAASAQASVFENKPEILETTAEKYVRKERERKARRRERAKAQRQGSAVNGDEDEEDKATRAGGTEEEETNDRGFDDPFFTATSAKTNEEARRQQNKANKKKKKIIQEERQTAAAERLRNPTTSESEKRVTKSRPDKLAQSGGSHITNETEASHFSLSALERAEKVTRKQNAKKGKKQHLSQREQAALEAKARDDFAMDVTDTRFAAVFEQPAFALDPSHPRFRDTQGMNSLLQEARQRRKRKIDEADDG